MISDETEAAAEGAVSIFTKIVKEKIIRLAIINTAKEIKEKGQQVVDKAKEVVDKTKEKANEFSRDLNNFVPVPHW